ncbi:hypothetical protein [Endozoicomonas acroporae]|uniref:hypothetical protein n=1 Tax=Endozoicomonas acroporae TaxID=1701104 RepID=UPI003D7A2E22
MIQQPIQQPTQQPICDSASQCSGNGAEYSWLGHGVAVCKAFATSLIPTEDPCLSFNSRKAVEDLVRLATATILPASSILFIVKDMANAWSGSGLPGPDAKPELPQTSKETREEALEKEPGSKDVPLQQPSTARYQGNQGTKGLLALGTLASSFQYGNSKLIYINDAEDLGNIGPDSNYRLDDTYQQTANIVVTNDFQSIGDDTHPFTGEYDGQSHTISGLSDCFVNTLKGIIRNLHFTGANINSQKTTGLAACVVEKSGTVSNIRAKDVCILTKSDQSYAGIGGGKVIGTVTDTTAVNSRVETSGNNAHAGIGGGLVSGTVRKTTAVNSWVDTKGYGAYAGIGGGGVNGGKVEDTTAVNSNVTTKGDYAYAGIGGGAVKGPVADTTAVNSRVKTTGQGADAGIGAGLVFKVKVADTTAVNSRVDTSRRAKANIGAGYDLGTVVKTKAKNSFVNNKSIKNCGSIPNDQLVCQNADLRVLKPNCSPRTEFRDALDLSVCPVKTDATASTAAKESTPITAATASTAAKESTAAAAATTVSTDATASTAAKEPTAAAAAANTVSTAATVGGITTGSLLAGGLGLGIVGYSSYQWITGYREGLRGQKLAVKPLTRGRELASAAVNSVSQGIQGIRERMSSTNFGRNRAEPMPPPASGRPRAERPLPAPPRDHYQPLSFRPRNTRPLPAPRQDHYQPLSFRSRNTRPLPAPPGHYQTLTFRQGNTATGDYNPLMGNEKEPAPSDIPVYLELIGYESTDNHGEPLADGQAGIATGSNSVANTGKPTPLYSPVYHVLTEHGTDSDDNHGEPGVGNR